MKAMNSHEILVEALENLARAVGELKFDGGNSVAELARQLHDARAALVKAKEDA